MDAKQFELLEQVDIAKSFMVEVLADVPEALDEMLQFTAEDPVQMQHKTIDLKTAQLAQVIYRIQSSLSAKGVVMWLHDRKPELGLKTPYQVINQPKYDSHEHQLLMDLARRANVA